MAVEKTIKCLVFDLDNTVWKGVLSEGGGNELLSGVRELITTLDSRGIIMSIASKNDESAALARLREFGLEDYFLCPQISWGAKSASIENIIATLNIKEGAVAFVDDTAFERDEVRFRLPSVRVYDAKEIPQLLSLPEFTPTFITEDAINRRNMYRADMKRVSDEKNFDGSADEFLSTLGMHLTISRITEKDLERVEELTLRTHQLNSTGYTYDYDELKKLIYSPDHIFLIASLVDKYGDSGKVGIMLLEKQSDRLVIKLLIISCRVMTRGIGTALLIHAVRVASERGVKLCAEFLETEHNRIMYITYKLMGFDEVFEDGNKLLLEYVDTELPEYPAYLEVSEL